MGAEDAKEREIEKNPDLYPVTVNDRGFGSCGRL
jgi:hypothetical protein